MAESTAGTPAQRMAGHRLARPVAGRPGGLGHRPAEGSRRAWPPLPAVSDRPRRRPRLASGPRRRSPYRSPGSPGDPPPVHRGERGDHGGHTPAAGTSRAAATWARPGGGPAARPARVVLQLLGRTGSPMRHRAGATTRPSASTATALAAIGPRATYGDCNGTHKRIGIPPRASGRRVIILRLRASQSPIVDLHRRSLRDPPGASAA